MNIIDLIVKCSNFEISYLQLLIDYLKLDIIKLELCDLLFHKN